MKKRTKILTLLAAAVLAVSVTALGFSAWSTDISINGTVSADGKWDVEVTAAEVTVSEGASIATTESEEAVEAFTAYVATVVENAKGKDILTYSSDDTETVELSADEVADYDAYVYSSTYKCYFYGYFTADGTEGVTCDKSNVLSGYEGDDGAVIGYVIKAADVKNADYDSVRTVVTEDETTFDATSIDYADVVFSLPGAYAEYTFTVTNNGTVDAVLTEYSFDFGSLDMDIFTVDYKEFEEDLTVPAGGSLEVLFTITASDGVTEDDVVYELTAEAVDFEITLTFSAPTVDSTASEAKYTVIEAAAE